jgi:SAM-dependent methyltransferase
MTKDDSDVRAYYESGAELDRLDRALGIVEFERTKEILQRHLPPPPATVADIGGGPGRYAVWLAGHGYRVVHRDLMALHVDRTRIDARSAGVPVDSQVADARSLDLDGGSADCVLLLGPLYHLPDRRDRIRALSEAARIAKPGAFVFEAAISRWAARLHGVVVDRVYEEWPDVVSLLPGVERSGRLPPLFPGSFSGFCHRPDQLRAEVRAAGLEVVDLVNVEGIAFALADLEERLSTPQGREVVLVAARTLERVPELLGMGPHLLLTARVR